MGVLEEVANLIIHKSQHNLFLTIPKDAGNKLELKAGQRMRVFVDKDSKKKSLIYEPIEK